MRQVFEELFQAYQQRIPQEAEEQFEVEQWVDQAAIPYDCPGAQQLDLSFQSLPATTNIPSWLWTNVPYIGVFFGSVAFIFVCLWIAIFKCALCTRLLPCMYHARGVGEHDMYRFPCGERDASNGFSS